MYSEVSTNISVLLAYFNPTASMYLDDLTLNTDSSPASITFVKIYTQTFDFFISDLGVLHMSTPIIGKFEDAHDLGTW